MIKRAAQSTTDMENSAARTSHAHEEIPSTSKATSIAGASQRLDPTSSNAKENDISFSLVVKWTAGISHDGEPGSDGCKIKVKSTRLHLSSMQDVSKLGGLSRGLLDRAFPEEEETPRPDFLLSDTFLRFTPDESCLSFPMDVASTEFKLVASYQGWEYVVYASPLLIRDQEQGLGPENPVFVASIEFESVAVVLGNLGIRVSLVAYPIVAVSREWLLDIKEQIVNNPNFKGILTATN